MRIELFASSAERERMDKTSYLTPLYSLEGSLRSASSVISPSMMIELPALSANIIETVDGEAVETLEGEAISDGVRISDANYMYIPEFGRYYFIVDVVMNINRQYIITGQVDVLMSYKEYLKGISCYIERNEFDYDPFVEDSLLPMRADKLVREYVPDKGSLVTHSFVDYTNVLNHSLILTMATSRAIYSSPIQKPSGTNLPFIPTEDFSSWGSSLPYKISYETFQKIAEAVFEDDTLATYIKSAVVFPLSLQSYEMGSSYITKGYVDPSRPYDSRLRLKDGSDAMGSVMKMLSDYVTVADFVPFAPSDFMGLAPYRRWEIYLPFYGYTDLNYDQVKGHRLLVYYSMSYEDGTGNVYVYDFTQKRMCFSSACQIGQKLSFTTTNTKENETQRTSNNLNLAVRTLGSIGTVIGGIATENPLMIAGGIMGGVGAVSSYASSTLSIFDRASVSYAGSFASLYAPLEVSLRVTDAQTTISDLSTFAHQVGRPLRRVRSLGSLSGFTIAKALHLEGLPCFAREGDLMKELFSNGVIL